MLHTLFIIVGPIVLVAAIAWAMLHNKVSPKQQRRTEEATRELYRDQSRDDETPR